MVLLPNFLPVLKKSLSLLLAATLTLPAFAQKKKSSATGMLERPKLVVGIVVDQMRYDYLYRYWNKYGSGGFRRLLGEGFSYENAHYNYVPTYTGPGHASIYTGTTPSGHGIVGNNWLVRETGQGTYVTEDKTVQPVGGSLEAGQQSPDHMLATTITDELRLASNFESKVMGVCIKDRGSILPAGHAANAAYWYDGTNGAFISSTFYLKQLPEWVAKFNAENRAAKYLDQPWNTLLPIGQYTESSPDDVAWEAAFRGETRPVFPHDLPTLSAVLPTAVKGALEATGEKTQPPARNLDLIRSHAFRQLPDPGFRPRSPAGRADGPARQSPIFWPSASAAPTTSATSSGPTPLRPRIPTCASTATWPACSSSSTKPLGRGNTLVFLTADHGAAHSPNFLLEHKLPAGSVGPGLMRDSLQQQLVRRHGPGKWVLSYENEQVYLNRPLIAQKKLDLYQLQRETAELMLGFAGVTRALAAEDVQKSHWESGMLMYLENGYFPKR